MNIFVGNLSHDASEDDIRSKGRCPDIRSSSGGSIFMSKCHPACPDGDRLYNPRAHSGRRGMRRRNGRRQAGYRHLQRRSRPVMRRPPWAWPPGPRRPGP